MIGRWTVGPVEKKPNDRKREPNQAVPGQNRAVMVLKCRPRSGHLRIAEDALSRLAIIDIRDR